MTRIPGPILQVLTLGLMAVAWMPAQAANETKPAQPDKLWVYVGTYTGNGSKGIYLCHLDLKTGQLTPGELAAEVTNPSFLSLHPSRPWLYSVGEVWGPAGKSGGPVSGFSIQPKTGKLQVLNQQSSQGSGPCHVAVDRTGKCVLVANYGGGSVASLAIGDDGRLGDVATFIQHKGSGADKQRQQGPHAHGVTLDSAGRRVFVPDLGLDKIMIYRLDTATGKLTANDPPWGATAPAAGPRHFAFLPSGQFAYVINELNSTVTAFKYDAKTGALDEIQTLSSLPSGFTGKNYPAEIAVHPSGQFVYGSNRGHDSIAIFAVDAQTGKLTSVGHEPTQGRAPRSFAIDPTGSYLLAANQDGNNVVVFRIDQKTGKLSPTGSSVKLAAPVCVVYRQPLE